MFTRCVRSSFSNANRSLEGNPQTSLSRREQTYRYFLPDVDVMSVLIISTVAQTNCESTLVDESRLLSLLNRISIKESKS